MLGIVETPSGLLKKSFTTGGHRIDRRSGVRQAELKPSVIWNGYALVERRGVAAAVLHGAVALRETEARRPRRVLKIGASMAPS
jgi:hypothetical protein